MPPRIRRGKGRIVYQILSLCKDESVSKTGIVYESNMNFKSARDYLDLLVKNGLLEASGERKASYKTTQKGIELLEYLRVIREILPELCD